MKHFLRTLLPLVCAAGLLAGCHNEGDKKEEERAAVLHRPPFAALTDSLRSATDRDAAGLYFRRAELLSRANLHELAAADYHRSWDINPDELTGYRYASTLSITGQTEKAIQLLTDCSRKYPSNPAFPGLLGELYQQSGRMKEALAIYRSEERRVGKECW